MKLKEKTSDKISFVEEVEESLVNAIRRYVNEIPISAIDEVEIFKNDSALYDETIAHRLGLIPLKTDKDIDDKKSIKLKLVTNKEGIVYSRELKGNISPVYEDMPITALSNDQELEVVAEVRTGRGKEHAKFSPGLIFYNNVLEIKTGSKSKEIAEIFSQCPHGCGRDMKIENNHSYELEICDACEYSLEKIGIRLEPTAKQAMHIESFGQLNVKEILPLAIKELKKDLNAVSKKL